MASSYAARMSVSEQPSFQHTLYAAIRAKGTPPLAVPSPRPYRFAWLTRPPAAVDAVCVPCPFVSLGPFTSPGEMGRPM